MDVQRFDSLTKLLGRGQSRRTVVRGIAAAALGFAAGGGLAGGAAARECTEIDRRCARNAECCSGTCRRDRCACPPGIRSCGGVTPRLLADAAAFFSRFDGQLDRSDIVVFSSEAVRWPDACLGCAAPGQECQQVVTSGFRVVVGVAGNDRRLIYHTRRATDEYVRCERAEGSCPAGREACGRVCCGADAFCNIYDNSDCCANDSDLCFA